MDKFTSLLAKEFSRREEHIENILRLLDEGNTVPFIARYRKEMHGTTDDQTIRAIADRLAYLRGLDERKAAVVSAIEAQGKLTDELSAAIENAQTLAEVEDIYRPYKQKRRTRATIAREKGLAPLAELLLSQTVTSGTLEALAAPYVNEEKGVMSTDDALAGAGDIIAETISDDAAIRAALRRLYRPRAGVQGAVPPRSRGEPRRAGGNAQGRRGDRGRARPAGDPPGGVPRHQHLECFRKCLL